MSPPPLYVPEETAMPMFDAEPSVPAPEVVPPGAVPPGAAPPGVAPPGNSPPSVEELGDASRLSSGRAPLRLTDLVAAVRVTGVPNVQAVADRLETNYDVTTEAGTLSMVLVAMHAARQDLARSMREDVLRLRMAGATAETIVQSALRYFDTVLADEFTY